VQRLGFGLLEWKKIVLGYKYNEEEFIKIFLIPRKLFYSFLRLLKFLYVFQHNGLKQQKHYCAELNQYMGSEGNACSAVMAIKEGLSIGKGWVRNYLLRLLLAVSSSVSETMFRNHICEKYLPVLHGHH